MMAMATPMEITERRMSIDLDPDELEPKPKRVFVPEHPLTNNLVTSLLFKHLSIRDLLSCRLVCRAWEEESRGFLAQRMKVTLSTEEKLKEYTVQFFGDRGFFDTVQLGPYMYMGNAASDRFFQLYGLYISHLILHKSQVSAVQLREILFRWAPNLEEFTLVGMTPGKTRLLEDINSYDKLNLPNLQVININLLLTQGEDMVKDFLFDLFSVTPNLKKIVVPKNSYKGFLQTLISTLLESPDLPLDNLAHVDALFSFGDYEIEHLTMKKYPLEYLNMQLMPNVSIEALLGLLDRLWDSLKSLRLFFYLTMFKELPPCVRLDRLENLSLDTYKGSLKFISRLPELRRLSVSMKCLDELEEALPRTYTGPQFWCSPTLKSFQASLSVVEGCPSGLIMKFEHVFPGLISISLPGITDIALKLICSTFPKLQSLTAPQGLYTDMGITGMAENKLRFLSRSCNLFDLEELRNSCEGLHSGNLTNLSKLEQLHLQSPDLTDDTIFFAILHMKSLKELSIDRSDITDRGIDAIMNHMNLQRLTITLCTRVSGPQLELVKAKLKNRNMILNVDGKTYSMYD